MRRLILLVGVVVLTGCGAKQASEEYSHLSIQQLTAKAEKGDIKAQVKLGFKYENGEGVAKDLAEAVKWRRRAAEQGEAWAQNNLGRMYRAGEGVAKDDVQSYKWFYLAAAGGDDTAKEFRNGLEKTLTPEQIAEGQRLCREFNPKHEVPIAPASQPH